MAEDVDSYHSALIASALARLGDRLHVSDCEVANIHERAIIDLHLTDIVRIPRHLTDRLVNSGLAGVYIGAGSVIELDNLRFLDEVHPVGWRPTATYADVPALYDRNQKYIVAGTTMSNAVVRRDVLHEYGHALGRLIGLNTASELRERHADANYWMTLPPYVRGQYAGDEGGRRELLAELFRDRILNRNDAISRWGLRLTAWLDQELRL